jgi:hypothetical protein
MQKILLRVKKQITHLILETLKEGALYIDEIIEAIKKERSWLESAYQTIENLKVYPSVTNFFLLRILKKDFTILKRMVNIDAPVGNNSIVKGNCWTITNILDIDTNFWKISSRKLGLTHSR